MVDWQQVDTVLLDMDGTLLDLHFDNFFWLQHLPQRYAEIHGLSAETARETLTHRFGAERGTLNWYCTDYWSEQLSVDIAALKREVSHLVASRPFVEDFLRALRRSQRRTVLVTNAHRDSLGVKLERFDLSTLVDDIVVSHDYRAPKEHESFWQRLRHEHPFEPGRTLLVDDTESVLAAAEDFGIAHLLTLRQPDSRGPLREHSRYPVIHHFDEIMPPEAQRDG